MFYMSNAPYPKLPICISRSNGRAAVIQKGEKDQTMKREGLVRRREKKVENGEKRISTLNCAMTQRNQKMI